jgi:ABC-type uncharacterized transport system ATPase subunit
VKLEIRDVSRRFGDTIALDRVSLTVAPGEVVALLGENGAGKSTLMNIIFGMVRPNSGEILIDGSPQHFRSSLNAMQAGIGMVHQHFMLVDAFTIGENVMLGAELRGRLGFLNRAANTKSVKKAAADHGISVDASSVVGRTTVGIKQRVEILKALARDAELLILDEPTAVLTPQETDTLLDAIRALAASGKSIVLVTHKLREVRAVADRVMILRKGRVVGETDGNATEAELARMMVGRDVIFTADREPSRPGKTMLEIENVTLGAQAPPGGAKPRLNNISLQVKAGEIVGVAGVEGNGQSELIDCIRGLLHPDAGRISVNGRDLTGVFLREILHGGLAVISEDRGVDGVIGNLGVSANLALTTFEQRPASRFGILDRRYLADRAKALMEEFDIRAFSIDSAASTLSGGNQQKIVLARALADSPAVLIAAQPTRGLDVGSIELIHKRIIQARDQGTAVLLISVELDEILSLSDRIVVMHGGKLDHVPATNMTRETIGLMMSGAVQEGS